MERANLVKGISNVAELEKKIGAGQVRLFLWDVEDLGQISVWFAKNSIVQPIRHMWWIDVRPNISKFGCFEQNMDGSDKI